MDTKKLRQKILDLAIHGKLVPQDPNDEPASVFLERIRAEKERLISEGKIKRSRKTVKTSDTLHYEQDMPFEVPQGWVWTTLESCTINRDNERIPVASAIRSKQQQKKYDYYGAAGIIDKVDNYIFNERLLLVGEDGANLLSRAKNNAFFAEGKFWVNNHAHILDSYPKKVLDFVAIVINSMNLEKYISGSAQPKLSQDNLNRIPIPLPPLAEQQRIVAEIERWFSLIDTIEQGKENLQNTIKQTKNKILDLAIHGKLVPQDPSDEPASELLKRINPKAQITCDNEHSEKLPKGWYLSTLGDCFKWGSGGTPESTVKAYYEGNIPWLVIGDLNDSIVTFASKHISQLGIYNSSAKVLTKGTLLMAMYGSIGKLGIAGMELATNQAIAYAKPNEINTYYLFYYLLANRDNFYMLGKGGTQKNISQTLIKSYPFLLPPLAEQKRIVLKIEELFSIIDTVEQTLQA